MLLGYFSNLRQGCAAVFRQMERIKAPVVRVGSPLHQLPLFEVIQDGYQPAGVNPQLLGEFLLAQSGRNAQQAQDSGIRRRELQVCKSFSKLRCGMGPKLGKEKGWASDFCVS
ncbi:MAG: hypothetical protein WA374_04130 [Acidobacteriaceae bacterium]